MKGKLEKPFTREGVEYSVECLDILIDDPQKESVYSYHYHEFIELLYAISPGATIWINGKCHKFNVGQLAVINSRELHTVTYEDKARYICVKFSPHILYANDQALFEFKYLLPFLNDNSRQKIFNHNELSNIEEMMMEILNEWRNMEIGYELVLRANLLKISAEIFRHWQMTIPANEDIQLNDTIKKALPYIAENYNTVTEKEVASFCGLSYNHFSYIFKKTLGKSFSDYITLLKIQEAEKLLLSTEMSITDIAYQVGFSSASHFISRFREQKKITPKQFREKILSSNKPIH